MRRIIMLVPLLLLLAAALMPLQAQQEETLAPECVAVVEEAYSALAQNCAGLAGGAACIGFDSVNATFAGDEVAFGAAGDVAALDALQAVNTLALNLEDGEWGMAVMNVFANVPLALAPTGLKYVLMGDTQVLNVVAPETAYTPVEAIAVTVLVGANLRSGPSTESQVLASAGVGTELLADARNTDSSFLRVVTAEGQAAWISSQVVATNSGDLNTLPVLTNSSRSLMQSICLRTGSESACGNAPSALVVQGPQNFASTITVNGADIRFDGTIVLTASAENVMRLFVLQGNAFSGGVSVPAGFTMDVVLSDELCGLAGLWSNLRPMNEQERALVGSLPNVPREALLFNISVPTQDEVLQTLAAINGSSIGAATGNGTLNCARFRPTSPLGGMPNGTATFFWDGVAGATSYRINIYNDAGQLVGAVDTGSTNTTANVATGTGNIGGGSSFTWEVQALLNGQVACTTARAQVVRDATSQLVSGGTTGGSGPQPTATPCGWQGC